MLIEAIYQILVNDSGVHALLTPRADTTTGVFPGLAPEEIAPPFIVIQQVSARPVTSFDGNNAFQEATFQFSCYASDFLTSHKLSSAVKNALSGIIGNYGNGGSPVVLTRIEGAWLDSERDLPTEEALHATLYGCQADFAFHFVDFG